MNPSTNTSILTEMQNSASQAIEILRQGTITANMYVMDRITKKQLTLNS